MFKFPNEKRRSGPKKELTIKKIFSFQSYVYGFFPIHFQSWVQVNVKQKSLTNLEKFLSEMFQEICCSF